jgi:hypothetical protein
MDMAIGLIEGVIIIMLFLAPLIIPPFILIKYGRNDIGRYIAFLTLKPVITYPIWILIVETSHSWFFNLEHPYPSQIILASIRALPEIIITLVIVYWFRCLFSRDKSAWFFLVFDLVRWASVFVVTLVLTLPYGEGLFKFMTLFFPGLYAFSGLVAVNGWSEMVYSQLNIKLRVK